MKATLNGQVLQLVAENEEEQDYVRKLRTNRILLPRCSSVGVAPVWVELSTARGFDYWRLRRSLNDVVIEGKEILRMIASTKEPRE